MRSSMRRTARCWAAAALMARFIGRPDRTGSRNARPSAAAETGEAKITRGYRLKARHVIHAVGPVWSGGRDGRRRSAGLLLSRRVGACSRLPAGLAGVPGDLDRGLSFSAGSRGADRGRHRRVRSRRRARGIARWCSAAFPTTSPRIIARRRSWRWGWPDCRPGRAERGPGPHTPCPIEKLRRMGPPPSRGRRLNFRLHIQPCHPTLQPRFRRRVEVHHVRVVPRHHVLARGGELEQRLIAFERVAGRCK